MSATASRSGPTVYGYGYKFEKVCKRVLLQAHGVEKLLSSARPKGKKSSEETSIHIAFDLLLVNLEDLKRSLTKWKTWASEKTRAWAIVENHHQQLFEAWYGCEEALVAIAGFLQSEEVKIIELVTCNIIDAWSHELMSQNLHMILSLRLIDR